MGLAKPFPDGDKGRAAVTRQASDDKVFKAPSLRNIEKTGPYFHNGSASTLDGAVRVMAEHQLGKRLSDGDVNAIMAWLKSLTGEIPKEYIKEPSLPKAGKRS